MGNRALIVGKDSHVGVYMHWNGGMDSVAPMLEYASFHSAQGLGKEAYDAGLATLVTIANNFTEFGSVYVESVDPEELTEDYGYEFDNGIYVVDGWNIVGRIGAPDQEQNFHDHKEMMIAFDKAQPEVMQLGEKFLNGRVIDTKDVEVGMEVFKRGVRKWEKHTVTHIGNPTGEKVPNGYPEHSPYTGEYPEWNVNGYVLTDTVRVAR